MIGGQVVDITAKPDEMDGERLYYMYERRLLAYSKLLLWLGPYWEGQGMKKWIY